MSERHTPSDYTLNIGMSPMLAGQTCLEMLKKLELSTLHNLPALAQQFLRHLMLDRARIRRRTKYSNRVRPGDREYFVGRRQTIPHVLYRLVPTKFIIQSRSVDNSQQWRPQQSQHRRTRMYRPLQNNMAKMSRPLQCKRNRRRPCR